MAWLEMRIIMAKLVWKFELRQAPDCNLGGGGQSEEWGRRREGQYQTWDVFGSKRRALWFNSKCVFTMIKGARIGGLSMYASRVAGGVANIEERNVVLCGTRLRNALVGVNFQGYVKTCASSHHPLCSP
jgi:hypothetical protein